MHDAEGSRKLAKKTIAEVYEATEGIDNDMFSDACELVTVLGKMMKRGLGTSKDTLRSASANRAHGGGAGGASSPGNIQSAGGGAGSSSGTTQGTPNEPPPPQMGTHEPASVPAGVSQAPPGMI